MAEQFGDKSQDATPYRRQKAREEGHVARSQDLASAVVLVGAVLVLMGYGAGLSEAVGRYTARQLGGAPWMDFNVQWAAFEFTVALRSIAASLLPVLGLFFLLAVTVHVGQTGFLFLPKKLAMDPNRVNPIKGIQRLFSLTNVMRLAFGIFKMIVVTTVAVWSLWADHDAILSLASLSVREIAATIFQITIWTTLKIGTALLILALLDYAYQRWKHEQDIRMTAQEVREEFKTLQGDPQTIARRRAIQRQLAMNRLISSVPKSDVVVTNPTELAIAIQYDPETMAAPIVVAKGAGVLAQRIRRLALENNILIVERKPLAKILYKQVNQGSAIPAQQYAAVAEVLRYVYQLKGKTLPGMQHAA